MHYNELSYPVRQFTIYLSKFLDKRVTHLQFFCPENNRTTEQQLVCPRTILSSCFYYLFCSKVSLLTSLYHLSEKL